MWFVLHFNGNNLSGNISMMAVVSFMRDRNDIFLSRCELSNSNLEGGCWLTDTHILSTADIKPSVDVEDVCVISE